MIPAMNGISSLTNGASFQNGIKEKAMTAMYHDLIKISWY
jgi:hypothetical protein